MQKLWGSGIKTTNPQRTEDNMHVETVSMDPRIARIHYNDYRKSCKEARLRREEELREKASELGKSLGKTRVEKTLLEKEDEHLLQAYRHLSRGETILQIHQVLAKAGLNAKKLPNFAVCRADAKWCTLEWHSHTGVRLPYFIPHNEDRPQWSYKAKKSDICMPRNFDRMAELSDSKWRETHSYPQLPARCMVPTVPVHLRPKNLEAYHILWEAEWEKAPPIDPILLKRVGDDSPFFTVVAQWDLSPLERQVLDGRFNG